MHTWAGIRAPTMNKNRLKSPEIASANKFNGL